LFQEEFTDAKEEVLDPGFDQVTALRLLEPPRLPRVLCIQFNYH
jgi:hypothetical protein